MPKYNCIIVDDNDIDRLAVTIQVKKHDCLEISGVFKSGIEALPILQKPGIDVLFLDIDMPSLSGLDFRKIAHEIPACVFITSHPEHAHKTYDLDTLDFIEKPVKSDRFAKTVERIQQYMELRRKASLFDATLAQDPIFVKDGYGKLKVDVAEVRYLEALKDYTKIALPTESHSILSNLGSLLDSDDFRSFVRIHRSFAVSRNWVKRIKPSEVELDNGARIPVGRSYRDILHQLT